MKITLCGSTRFYERFQELNEQLTAAGHTVYTVAFSRTPGQRTPSEEEKIILDLVHLQKIQNSDAIVVIGLQPDKKMYVGFSTKREIQWAAMNRKHVFIEKAMDHRTGQLLDIVDALKMSDYDLNAIIEDVRNGCSIGALATAAMAGTDGGIQ